MWDSKMIELVFLLSKKCLQASTSICTMRKCFTLHRQVFVEIHTDEP